ncbi:MAG: type II secretion system F family protein [Clostridium sp.]|nr:type II secretion system F family protein [Clostridium sp.]
MKGINGILYGVIFVLSGIYLYGKGRTKKYEWQNFLQGHGYLLVILFIANTISFICSCYSLENTIYVQREGYDGQEMQKNFLLEGEDAKEVMTLQVAPQMLTEKQRQQKLQEAAIYIGEHIQGENESLSHVTDSLNVALDREQFPFDIEVRPDDYSLLDEEGNVRNEENWLLEQGYDKEDLANGIQTGVTVILWYGEEKTEQHYELIIYPREKSGVEKQFLNVVEQIEKTERDTIYEEGFEIPASVEGIRVTDEEQKGISPGFVLLFGVLICGLLLLREQEEKKQQEQNRQESLLRCYPWFVNEMVLMLGAGMQVKNIFSLLVRDYQGEKKRKADDREPLIDELAAAERNLNMGMSEQQVYYRLGRRLKLSCYIKLMTLLEQNVKRGAKGLADYFEQEEVQALEERKNLAKRYGEEAGTKLLGPMMVVLLVIMLMIMIPAFMSFM